LESQRDARARMELPAQTEFGRKIKRRRQPDASAAARRERGSLDLNMGMRK
jgi:hypothetical protein